MADVTTDTAVVTRGADDKAAALRALLDEAGLVGVPVRTDGAGYFLKEAYADVDGAMRIWANCAADDAPRAATMVTARHDSAAAALGLPSAAEVREMRAEVERLRAENADLLDRADTAESWSRAPRRRLGGPID